VETVRLILGFIALFMTWLTIFLNEMRLVPICIALWAWAVSPAL